MVARIVQISDLHLTARPGVRTRGIDPWTTLASVLDAVAREEPELLVLTGDIATDGRAGTYEALRGVLDQSGLKVRVLPGNHDDATAVPAAVGGTADAPPYPFEQPIGGWRLLGLSSAVAGHVYGRLGEEQMRWLAERLARGDAPAMLLFHHPPLRVGTWWLDKDLLRDVADLEALLARTGKVRAIFAGHVHQEHEGTFAGIPVWTAPSTAYQFRPRSFVPARLDEKEPGYRVIDLSGETLETRVERVQVSSRR
jgi:Icc protein